MKKTSFTSTNSVKMDEREEEIVPSTTSEDDDDDTLDIGETKSNPLKEEEEEGGRAIRLPNGPKKIGKRKRSMEIFPTAKPYLVFTRDDVVSQRLKFGSTFLSSPWESKIALFF